MRHSILRAYDPRPGVSISTLAYEYRRGLHVSEHAHGSHQLIYAVDGVMEISSGQSIWLIPPHFAIWIPAGVRHSIKMPSAVSMRTLYMWRGLADGMPTTSTALHVSPLLRELILESVRSKELRSRNALHCALCDLLIAKLRMASPMPMYLTLPSDARARRIADAVIDNPAARSSLPALSAAAGASVRTIQRIFRREVGSDFEFWRRQARLLKAVELLVAGCSVKQVSFALGYLQPSAFVAMFRGVLGTPPRAWMQGLQITSSSSDLK